MTCANCSSTIDDDSFYCDQCGEAVLVCSECGRPGAGKRCIYDGKRLIPAAEVASGRTNTVVSAEVGGTGASDAPPLRLVSLLDGAELLVQPGSVIGRKTGPHAVYFGRYDTISSTHARIDRAPEGWSVTDLGSTNGTSVDGRRIAANVSTALRDQSVVTFADEEFTVRIDPPPTPAVQEGTVRITR